MATAVAPYRQRADTENVYDELKNQWGWGGFTTGDLLPCQVAARMVALVYNWWSLFVRCAEPERPRETITSRPLLLHAVGEVITTGRQTILRLTLQPCGSGPSAANSNQPQYVPERLDEYCGAVDFVRALATNLASDFAAAVATGRGPARTQRVIHWLDEILPTKISDQPRQIGRGSGRSLPSQLPFLGSSNETISVALAGPL